MERIINLIIVFIVAFILVKATTFGWRFWGNPNFKPTKENEQLAKDLQAHVYILSHEIGIRDFLMYKNLEKTAKYIMEQFTSFGYKVELQSYNLSGQRFSNIIATKFGVVKLQEVIIVGAHYDTCGNPGADDNASSIAGLLELARLISDKQTNRTIKFIAFVNEEPPFYMSEDMGSRVYARETKQRKEDIKAVLILEMIGYYSNKAFSQRYPPILGLFYPNKGNFIAVVGNFPSHRLVRKTVVSFKKGTRFPIVSLTTTTLISAVNFSDHWSFWKEGYPAVMITDTAFFRNPYYHSHSDTFEKLDYKSMAEVVKGLGAVIAETAK